MSGKLFLGEESFRSRQHLRELLDASKNRILLNLADVDRVDSAGIGILVEAVILTIKEGGELKLVNVPHLVHNVLVVHRLLSAFEIHSDEEEALASFK